MTNLGGNMANDLDTQILNQVFNDATTGALAHWATVGTVDGLSAVITDEEDVNTPDYTVDRDVLTSGAVAAYIDAASLSEYQADAVYTVARLLRHTSDQDTFDARDLDDETADLIVQYGLFGTRQYTPAP
jgi:hypothetical protein